MSSNCLRLLLYAVSNNDYELLKVTSRLCSCAYNVLGNDCVSQVFQKAEKTDRRLRRLQERVKDDDDDMM